MSRRMIVIGISAAACVVAVMFVGLAIGDDASDSRSAYRTAEIEALAKGQRGVKSARCWRVDPKTSAQRWRCRVVLRSGDSGLLFVRESESGILRSTGRGVPAFVVAQT